MSALPYQVIPSELRWPAVEGYLKAVSNQSAITVEMVDNEPYITAATVPDIDLYTAVNTLLFYSLEEYLAEGISKIFSADIVCSLTPREAKIVIPSHAALISLLNTPCENIWYEEARQDLLRRIGYAARRYLVQHPEHAELFQPLIKILTPEKHC